MQYLSVSDYIKKNNVTKLPKTRSRIGVAATALSRKRKVPVNGRGFANQTAKYRVDILDYIFKVHEFKAHGGKGVTIK